MLKPNLCFITHTFLPHVGGIEKVVYEQGKLLQHKYNIRVLTSNLYKNNKYTVNGIKVNCYNSLNIGFRLGIPYPIPSFNSYKLFSKIIKSSDLIHVHGHPYLSSLIASRLSKKYSKPLVLTQHNTFIQYNRFWNFFERINDLTIGKEILNLADKIIVVSNATKKYVLNLGANSNKINLIHNGVDVNRFKILTKSRKAIRKKLNISENSKVGLTVRRLVYKNGIDTLLSSAQKAIKKDPNIIFLIIGKGPDLVTTRQRIRNLKLEKNIKLLGFILDKRLPAYYNAADFFILPSKSGEGLPLVSLEAMACGLPVIATNVGGIKEILEEKYSIIIPPNNPDLMEKAIVKLSQRNFANKKENLRKITELKHSWNNNVLKLAEIYEELI